MALLAFNVAHAAAADLAILLVALRQLVGAIKGINKTCQKAKVLFYKHYEHAASGFAASVCYEWLEFIFQLDKKVLDFCLKSLMLYLPTQNE
jgi:hypothetical protein